MAEQDAPDRPLLGTPALRGRRRTFEPVPAGTRVRLAGEGTSGLFLNLLEPLVTAAAKQGVRRDLAYLKAVLEAGQ